MNIKKLRPFRNMIFLILGDLVLIGLSGSSFFYYVLLCLVILMFSMYILILNDASCMTFDVDIDQDSIVKGEPVKVKLLSKNNSLVSVSHGHLSCTLYSEKQKFVFPNMEVTFIPNININRDASFVMNKRGVFTHINVLTSIQDPLKMFEKSFEKNKPVDFIVFPKVYELSYYHMPSMGLYGTKKSLRHGQEDFSNIKKVRPYIVGDSFKRIHWKLSSKKNSIHVKEYEATTSAKNYIILDGHQGNYLKDLDLEIEDCAVEVAASICKYALKRSVETSLIFENNGITRLESRELSNFDGLLRTLVAFQSCGQLSFSELINEESKRIEPNSYITLITPAYSDTLIETLIGLRSKNFIFSLILIGNEKLPEKIKDYIEAMGIYLYEVMTEGSIVEELETFK